MANVYVDSNAAGAGTGADWANAYTTLAAALTAKAAGDNFWVAHNHAETQASAMTLTSPGTAAAPCTVMCVNSAGTVPPVSADLRTTATITTTGAFAINIGGTLVTNGNTYFYGITFSAGTTTSAANINLRTTSTGIQYTIYKNCKFILGGSSAGNTLITGTATLSAGTVTVFDGTTVKFAATTQNITLRGGSFVWKNTQSAIDVAGSIPSTLFLESNVQFLSTFAYLEGIDLSALGSNTIVGDSRVPLKMQFKNCKLGTNAVVQSAQTYLAGSESYNIISDASGTNYRSEKYSPVGTQTVETTIVRTGGATDGTTPISWKIVPTANAKWILPYESMPIAVWNDTTGSAVTVTVYGIWSGGAVPYNDDIWIEASYMGSSATPIATIDTSNTKADYLATHTAQASDSSTWGGSTTKFKMTATFTPQMKGLIYITVKVGAASGTFYVDPKVMLS